MARSIEEIYVQNLQDDIKTVVDRLAVIGLDSVVLVTSQAIQLQFGSTKGKQFLGEHPYYFEGFVKYCRDEVKKPEPSVLAGSDVNQETGGQASHGSVVTVKPSETALKELTPKDEPSETQIMPEAMFLEPELIAEYSQNHAIDDENISNTNDEESNQNQDHIIDTKKDRKETIRCNAVSEQRKSVHVRMMGTLQTPKNELKENSKSNTKQTRDLRVMGNLNGHFHETDSDIATCEEDNNLTEQVDQAPLSQSPLNLSSQQKTFNCDQCDKKYVSKRTLVVHQRLHTGDAPYICQTCGKTFRSNSLLKSHLTIHSSELNYKCKLCDKAFQWRHSLRRHHLSVHSDERRYVCELCGSDFNDLSALRKHKLRHTGEKNHACEICGKRFMLNYRLKEHMRVHSGVKKFECGVCHERYADRRYALKHQSDVHPDLGHHDLIVHH